MNEFEIGVYLENLDKATRRGNCKVCLKKVNWARDSIGSHKRKNCPDASNEEKNFFKKKKFNATSYQFNPNESSSSMTADDESMDCNITDEKRREVDSKLANFFYRTGISFRLVDSDAFKDFVKALNPRYAEVIPSAKTLAGRLLDEQFAKSSVHLNETLANSEGLTLITDGWTNVRGDHIVNFCVKAPGQKPLFLKSIDTSGVPQTAQAVAEAISTVIVELGAQKFSSIITDNAPVMKASWKLIEESFPNIFAMGCAAHGTNLLIRDILDTPEAAKTIKESEKIIKFVINHHLVKSKYLYVNCAFLDEKDKNDYILEDGAVLSGNDYQ